MRGARGLRDEFTAFHALAYPQLAAQTVAITGDAEVTRAAAAATLARVWRSWSSLRNTADVLVRVRWTAVLIAAERESTTPVRSQQASDAVEELTGASVVADTVVVAALQRLPRVQRRALVLHYMGGVSVRHLSALSGSSAEHIELLLDDGFRALADSLEWSEPHDLDGTDLSFDWVAEALADTAARLPEQIPAPPPTALLRNAAVVRWSVRAIPVAGVAACAALVAAVVQPEPPEAHVSAIFAQHDGAADGSAPAYAAPSGLSPEPAADADPRPNQAVRMRSIALTSLLDTDEAGRRTDSTVGRAPQTSAAAAAQAQLPAGERAVGGAEPGRAGAPAEPGHTASPTEPADAAAPGQPAHTAAPAQPARAAAPAEPAYAPAPGQPAPASAPTAPASAAAPAGPAPATAPAEPTSVAALAEPAYAAAPTPPARAAALAEPASAAAPAQSAPAPAPSELARAAALAEPAYADGPAQPAPATAPAEPGSAAAAGAGAAKGAAPDVAARRGPTADAGAPAALPRLQAAAGGGATRKAATAPPQDHALALPTDPSSGPAPRAVQPGGIAAAVVAPHSTGGSSSEPQATDARTELSATGEKAWSQPTDRPAPSTSPKRSDENSDKHGNNDTRGDDSGHGEVADR